MKMVASVTFVALVTLGFVSASARNVWHQDQGRAFLSAMFGDGELPQEFLDLFKLNRQQRDMIEASTSDPLLSLLEGLKFQHKGKKMLHLFYFVANVCGIMKQKVRQKLWFKLRLLCKY